MKLKLRGIKEWKKECQQFHIECVDYLDAFLVSGLLTGLNIEKRKLRDTYVSGIEWGIRMPGGTILQAEFTHWIGDNQIVARIFEMAFEINLTEEQELLDLGFKYEGEQRGYSDGEKFISALLGMDELKKTMAYLSGRWHYRKELDV
ncbi:MAG: hypothetical protein K0R18_526 [Bacillales bacterium]|nr:hypothetical protein [Bacillales bacterium]